MDFSKGNDQALISHMGLDSAVISFSAFLHHAAVGFKAAENDGKNTVNTTVLIKVKGETVEISTDNETKEWPVRIRK